jgi:PAS domain S-box-containing protein
MPGHSVSHADGVRQAERRRRKEAAVLKPQFGLEESMQARCPTTQEVGQSNGVVDLLRDSEERFSRLIETLPVGVTIVDLAGRITFANATAERILGLTRSQIAGRTYNDPAWKITAAEGGAFPEEELPFVKVMATGLPVRDVEHALSHPDGRRVILSVNASPLYDPAGRLAGVVASIVDVTDRRQREMQLELLRRAIDGHYDGAYWTDAEGRFIHVNETACRALGYERSELLQMKLSDVNPRASAQALEAVWQRLRTQGSFFVESVHRRKDGSLFPVDITSTYVRLGDCEVNCGFARDITDRRRAERALRASEHQYRTLVENLPDIVARFDACGRILCVSPSVARYTPLPVEALLGKTCGEIGQPEHLRALWENTIAVVVESGLPQETEFRFTVGDRELLFNWRLIPEFDEKGRCVSVLTLARDITEHRRTERNYRLLFEQMLNGFALHEIILDCSGRPVDYRFLSVNPAFEQMTGLKAGAIVGRTAREVLPELEESWIKTYGKVALSGQSIRFTQYAAPLGRYFEVLAFQVEPGQFVTVFDDVTARRQADQSLMEHRRRLRSLAARLAITEERERRSLAERLHDDVGQNLVFCKMKLQMIGKRVSDPSDVEDLAQVCAALDGLLTATRAMTFELYCPVLKVLGFEAAVSSLLKDEVEAKHAIQTEFYDDGQPKGLDDNLKALMFRSVRELVANAVKHSRAGLIRVAVLRERETLCVQVEDDGVGLVPSEAVSPMGKGFGLFSIQERLAELGGSLDLDSAPGCGCRATLRVPLDVSDSDGSSGLCR